jgi:23S rRNA (pseudouridine1915-N3)-methyltransferase
MESGGLEMKIILASVSVKRSGAAGGAPAMLRQEYLERAGRYAPCSSRAFATESALLEFVREAAGRTRPLLLLADSRGEQVSSEELAALIGRAQDDGVQVLVLGIGPADGWSAEAVAAAGRTIAFGRITLPHELAAVVAAEQIYRALTIRAGHPYHSGH